MTLTVRSFYSYIFGVICTIISAIVSTNIDTSGQIDWCRNISLLLIITLFLQIIVLIRLNPPKRLIIYIFWAFSYLFLYSHIFLQGIHYDFGSNTRNNIFFRNNYDAIFNGFNVSFKVMCATYIGIITFFSFRKEEQYAKAYTSFSNIRWMQIACVTIGFTFDALYSVTALISTLTYGYSAIQGNLQSYWVKMLGYLLLTGISLIMMDDTRSIQSRRGWLILFIIYKTITMFSGLRAYALLGIIIAMYVYYKECENIKLSVWKIIFILLAIHFGGSLLIGIRETRASGINGRTLLTYLIDSKTNVVLNMMSEFGITGNVICQWFSRTGAQAAGGTQLLYSFIVVIPFISMIAPNVDFASMNLEQTLDIHNYGGTYIADLLFDFGPFGGIIAGLILGFVLAYIFEKYENSIDIDNKITVALFAPIIVDFLFCVRSSISKMPRLIVWYLIIIFILQIPTKFGQDRFVKGLK